VQTALDIVSKELTTIIVAHRLSTIMNADKIIVLDKGEIVEWGNHDELMIARGKYYNLVKSQIEKELNESESKEKKSLSELEKPESTTEFQVIKQDEKELNNQIDSQKVVKLNSKETGIKNVSDDVYLNEIEIKLENGKNKDELNQSRKSPTTNYLLNNEMKELQNNEVMKKIGEDNSIITHKIVEKKPEYSLLKMSSKEKNTNSPVVDHSQNKAKLQDDELDPETKEYFDQARKRLISLLNDAKCVVFWGAVFAAASGAVWPSYGILLAESIDTLLSSKSGGFLAGMFMLLAGCASLAAFVQQY
jgi:ABC-type glutathione transport system ATPase component